MNKPVKGDVYKDRSITITIGDVDPEGRWAMIRCGLFRVTWDNRPWTQEWEKQQPLNDGLLPESWTKQEGPDADVDAVR